MIITIFFVIVVIIIISWIAEHMKDGHGVLDRDYIMTTTRGLYVTFLCFSEPVAKPNKDRTVPGLLT